MLNGEPEISIILPCLNEEESIERCINDIKDVIKKNNLNTEVIIIDNGSTDNSIQVIRDNSKGINGKLIRHEKRGYGSAYLKGIEHSKGKYIFMADSDGSYDFYEIPKFIEELRKGYDFVIGNRFKGRIEKGSMPFLNRYIGNPILSGILKFFFNVDVHDSHCGMRAIRKESLNKLNLSTTGMEFASEMVLKAGKRNLKIKELPINYHKRRGKSKLRSFPDAWRHMRLMLIYSPLYLFFIPGLIIFLLGVISMFLLIFNISISGQVFQYQPMFISSILIITGYQLIIFSLFAKTYAITHLKEKPILDNLYKYITIERASIIGIIIILIGFFIYYSLLLNWISGNFEGLIETRKSIIALTLITLGIQTIFSSFMLSILGMKED